MRTVNVKVASLLAQMVKKKNPPAMQETWVQSLGQEEPLEKGMAIHSNILARGIPWTEEPGGLQFMGLRKSWTWLSRHTRNYITIDKYLHSLYPHTLVLNICKNIPAFLCLVVPEISYQLPSFLSFSLFSVHTLGFKFKLKIVKFVPILHEESQGKLCSSRPRDWTRVTCITGRFFTVWATREDQ